MIVRLGVFRVGRGAVRVVVEFRAVYRLSGHRPHGGHGVHAQIVEAGRLGAWVGVVEFLRLGHQSTYLATGGAGAGPSTDNHLRYSVFHVPSRRTRSRVPLTKRTNPVFSRLMPMP